MPPTEVTLSSSLSDTPEGPRPSRTRGRAVGRFLLLDEIGAGGMGTVFSAYDPDLERKVAIKILHAPRGRGSTARLRREAQAMARVSSPHVTTVYEIGQDGDDVFIAMEFAGGGTLKQWLREERPWSTLVARLCDAGWGLAAAHRAGLVHCDFKPSNVLLTTDGRVMVSDFGLGHAIPEPPPHAATGPSSGSDSGSVAGTPAYMAPEQHQGHPATPHSDQFSFCVTLYEALVGKRPFPGRTSDELLAAIRAGLSEDRSRHVPARVLRIVMRGLSVEPGARHPSMDALLTALDEARTRKRRRAGAVAVVALGAALAGMLGWRASAADTAVCTGGDLVAAGVWSSERRAALGERLASFSQPQAADVSARALDRIDRYVSRWHDIYIEACQATHVRGEQSDALLDRRMQCLRERREHLDALLTALGAPQLESPDPALTALADLPALDDCSDLQGLAAAHPAPATPSERSAWAALRADLAAAEAAVAIGDYDVGLTRSTTLVERADALGYPPARVETRDFRAFVLQATDAFADAETVLDELLPIAAAMADHRSVARAWVRKGLAIGAQDRYDEALALREIIELTIAQAGNPPALRAQYLEDYAQIVRRTGDAGTARVMLEEAIALRSDEPEPDRYVMELSLGHTFSTEGNYELALHHYRRSLDALVAGYGDKHPRIVGVRLSVATALKNLARYEEARVEMERALDESRRLSSPDAGTTAMVLGNFSDLAKKQGRPGEAVELARQAVEIQRAAGRSGGLATALQQLGGALRIAGRHEASLAAYRESLALDAEIHGADSFAAATTMTNFGNAQVAAGNLREAEALLSRAQRIFERTRGPQFYGVGLALSSLGEISIRQRDYRTAIARGTRALPVLEGALGPAHPMVTAALRVRGVALLETGRASRALADLQRAVDILETAEAHDPADTATARFELARALWATGDRGGGHALARSARDALRALPDGEATAEKLTEIDAWLARHRPAKPRTSEP